MKKIFGFLTGVYLVAATAHSLTITEELSDYSDEYGVFWCPQSTARIQTENPMNTPTEAEFNQKITIYVKDLGQWWTVMKEKGLAEDKTLDSFINRLVLVIDGVPIKHLQPIAFASHSPSDPYHVVPTNDLATANRVWRDWTITSARRNAENRPTSEALEHVEKRVAVVADRALARRKESVHTPEETRALLALAAQEAWELGKADFAQAQAAGNSTKTANDAAVTQASVTARQAAADSGRQLTQMIELAQKSCAVAVEAIKEWQLVAEDSEKAAAMLSEMGNDVDRLSSYSAIAAQSPTGGRELALPPAAGKGERYHFLSFLLERKDEDRSAWMEILRPDKVTPERKHRCRISVGFERKDGTVEEMVSWVRPISPGRPDRPADQFYLVTMSTRMLTTFGVVFSFALLVLCFAGTAGMLRDHDAPLRPDGKAPYSLARCQMALWFFLVSLAFVFLWQMLGRKDTVNNTATILLGISSFTAVGSALIGKGSSEEPISREQLEEKRRALTAELNFLRRQLATLENELKADPADSNAESEEMGKKRIEIGAEIESKNAEIKAKNAQISSIRKLLNYGGPLGVFGFFKDLLRDSNQHLSIARFQMMVWTLVLAVVFFVEVYWRLAMPEFNPAILALLGITSGAYLGFKGAAEKQQTP